MRLSPVLLPWRVSVRVPVKLPPNWIAPVFVKTSDALLLMRLAEAVWMLLP